MEEKKIISDKVIDLLACPACKTDVSLIKYEEEKFGLICDRCQRVYPIKDGIPIMLIEESFELKER